MKLLYMFHFLIITVFLFFNISCTDRGVEMHKKFDESDLQIIFWEHSPYTTPITAIDSAALQDTDNFHRKILTMKDVKYFYWDEQIIEFSQEAIEKIRELTLTGYDGYMSIILEGKILYTAYTLSHIIAAAPRFPIFNNEVYYSTKYLPFLIITPYEDWEHMKTFKNFPEESRKILQIPELYIILKKSGKLRVGYVDLYKLLNTDEIYYGGWNRIIN